MGSSQVSVGDAVQFRHGRRTITGNLVKKSRTTALVVSNGREFDVPWNLLERDERGERRRLIAQAEGLKAKFRPGDRVRFPHNGGTGHGVIGRLGPKRALVDTEDGSYYVHYEWLRFAEGVPERNGEERLAEIADEADRLLREHGLSGWSFQFDDASSRAGSCDFGLRVITVADQYAVTVSDRELRNTILHEIAHALVGPKHNHDARWKSVARSIGCSADSCHNIKFAPPLYIQSCPRCGWKKPAMRRSKRLVCASCQTPVRYRRNIEQGRK